jgi:hypothetical protein
MISSPIVLRATIILKLNAKKVKKKNFAAGQKKI